MIKNVELRTEPIAAGEVRELRVYAADPIQVDIKCFVYKPPPKRYTTCPECGSFKLSSGEPLLFQASDEEFREGGGTLVISIKDKEGDTAEYRLEVANWENPATGGKTSSPSRTSPAGSSAPEPALSVIQEEATAEKTQTRSYEASV